MNDPEIVKDLSTFFSQYRKKRYKKNTILIESSHEPEGIFFITEGLVKRAAISESGIEATLNMYKPNAFFPMDWAINNIISPHFYQALTDVEVLIAPKEDVMAFLRKNPEIVMDLLSRIYRGMEGMFLRLEYLLSGKATGNVIVQILILAKRLRSDSRNPNVTLKIAQNEIAAESGLARETVSRVLIDLKKKKLIEYKNGSLTVDINQLESYLQDEQSRI